MPNDAPGAHHSPDSPSGSALPTSGAARPADAVLIDKYGRQVTYLRLSITDRCDFRCRYCMAEEMEFLPRAQVLTLEECLRLASAFVELGVSKLRITGGEPLVRRNAIWLLERLTHLPGLRELVMTTNGSQLARFAPALRAAGVRRINISLDTLRAERFRRITRVGDLSRVLAGIAAARTAGFERLKINTVLLRGVNDDEICDLVRFAIAQEVDIAFIEQMPFGELGQSRRASFLSSDEALTLLRADFVLVPSAESTGGPARYWRIPGQATRVGFIAPHSHNFCAACNRVRVSARGELFPCLGSSDAVHLLPLLRAHPADDAPVRAAIAQGMGFKPKGHEFGHRLDAPHLVRFMSMTGG